MSDAGQAGSGFVEVGGGKLYYETAGAGHPLVLIHAGVAHSAMWDDQWAEFARHYRVIRYDTRGFGRSATEDVEFANRRDLAALLDHLGVASAYVVGVSRAGAIAIDFTLEYPERVDALIPVAAGVSGFEPQPSEANKHEWAMFDEMDAAEERKDIERLLELELRMWVDGPAQPVGRAAPALRQRVYEMMRFNADHHETGGKHQPLDPPALGRLGEIKAPTLVIVGEYDTTMTLAMADLLAEGIPGARKALMRDTAHVPNMEKPAEFSKLVLEFLAGLPQKRA